MRPQKPPSRPQILQPPRQPSITRSIPTTYLPAAQAIPISAPRHNDLHRNLIARTRSSSRWHKFQANSLAFISASICENSYLMPRDLSNFFPSGKPSTTQAPTTKPYENSAPSSPHQALRTRPPPISATKSNTHSQGSNGKNRRSHCGRERSEADADEPKYLLRATRSGGFEIPLPSDLGREVRCGDVR